MVDADAERQHPATLPQGGSRLLSLSTELLLLILEYLPNTALLAVSKASQRLHCCALPVYLSRHGISPRPTSLVLHGKAVHALPGLRASLSITSLDSISCKFEGPDEASFTRDVTNLFRFIHKLANVDTVTLHMGSIDARWVYGFATAKSDAWKPTFLRLLNTILERQCSSLTVTHGHFVLPISPKDGPAWHQQIIGTSESAAVARTFLGVSLAVGRPRPSIERRPSSSSSHLKSLFIHSNVLLVQPFYDWTLRTLNTCDVISLSISLPGITPETWALILPTITLPALIEFTAGTTDIAFPDLIQFLSRHPSIHRLNLHPHFSYPDLQKRLRLSKKKQLLPQLTSLGGNPRNITAVLSHLYPPPQLDTIALSLPMHQRVFQSSDFEQLSRHIASVMHNIAVPRVVTLEFSVPYETSAIEPPELEGENGIVGVFRSVQTLGFSTDGHFAFAKWVVPVLPAWLANFIALRHVRFAGDCVPIEQESRERLVASIGVWSPEIQTVTVGNHVKSFR